MFVSLAQNFNGLSIKKKKGLLSMVLAYPKEKLGSSQSSKDHRIGLEDKSFLQIW
jgi:hypothetical protein